MKRSLKVLSLVVVLGAVSAVSQASLLDQLYNTGIGDNGGELSTSTPTVDTHYTLDSSPEGYTAAYAVTGYETGDAWGWLPSSSNYTDANGKVYDSEWISPIWQDGEAGNVGNYLWPQYFNYSETIDLGTATSAVITGEWMADNGNSLDGSTVTEIYVNGKATGETISTSPVDNGWGSFQEWHPFTLSGSYFTSGVNTITFSVVNWAQGEGNPTGLRVVYTSATAVPEPFALGLAALGIGLVRVVRRRRNR
jgi:hypothetical protein